MNTRHTDGSRTQPAHAKRPIRWMWAPLVIVATTAATASSAEAATVEKVVDRPYEFAFEGACDFGTEDTSDDIRVIESYSGIETYTVRAKPDGTIFFQGHFEQMATYLNPDTGRSFTSQRETYEHDVKVLSFDPSSNQATMLTSRHDTLLVYSDQGALDARSSQLAQFTLIVDLDTMEASFGQFLKQNGASRVTGFCDDLLRFTVE